MPDLSHFDDHGNAVMVDISPKPATSRLAVAVAMVYVQQPTLQMIADNQVKKGDVLSIAQIAGIMATKKTADLIPLCHPLPLSSAQVTLRLNWPESAIDIESRCKITGKTGVEMEALTGVSVAALTVYDMVKAVDKTMVIGNIRLIYKEGGKSGTIGVSP